MRLSDAERGALLRIARTSVARSLGVDAAGGSTGGCDDRTLEALRRRAGAFVTLRVAGALRGCLGHVRADAALADVVASMAVAAACSDPRFPPLTALELARAEFEVSVLGPLTEPAAPERIEVGRHGVVVDDGPHQGLLLPQVAVEQGWDASTLLTETCRKARLPADAWRRGARVRVFETERFGERAGPPREAVEDPGVDGH